MKSFIFSFLLLCVVCKVFAQSEKDFCLKSGEKIEVSVDKTEEPVVFIALDLFRRDCQSVLSSSVEIAEEGSDMVVGTIGRSKLLESCNVDLLDLSGLHEAFKIEVLSDGRLLIAGSDKRGTAYGILEVSRLMGVSPWEWWADAVPCKRDSFSLSKGYVLQQSPSVPYRGVFINDEDWGLLPWSNKTYEPSEDKSNIGSRTYERVFELLLRLRANTLWPAMHECTKPFFLTEGNRKAAADYGILIGTSHCEPMLCNAAGEWKIRGNGEYNYVSNRENVIDFWENRLKEVSEQDNIYTLGMRGVHDGKMQGVKSVEQQKEVLTQVISTQRDLLKKYIDTNVVSIPQVFIPYKEVLDVYNAGLSVPDDVTLMWCDDNYGYIRHFPTEAERLRKGGNGIYYHVSYWGRPHDYLWLGTANPALLFQQMKLAYEQGIQTMWILNVGDIKPSEYQIELFLDMAWNFPETTDEGVNSHLSKFLVREFGTKVGNALLPVMNEFYRLSYIRKPEFMGNTRTEEKDPQYKVVKDLPWTEQYIRERLIQYNYLYDEVERLSSEVSELSREAYFQIVEYPVKCAALMNDKMLSAQLARHGKAEWKDSDTAFDSIVALTNQYNSICSGKWNKMMDYRPRRLPVYDKVKCDTILTPLLPDRKAKYLWNGADCYSGKFVECENLGYGGRSAAVGKDDVITFNFEDLVSDSIEIEISLLPSHPVNSNDLRISVSIDDSDSSTVSYRTVGRSEEWKENVLNNRAIRRFVFPLTGNAKHNIFVKALDDGVVVDQVAVYEH